MSLAGFVKAGVQLGLQSLLVKPKRGIFPATGPTYIPQVTITERGIDELEITEHPVEQGAAISDHAFKRPAEIVIEVAWSNSAGSSSDTGGGPGGLVNAAIGFAASKVPAINKAVGLVSKVQGLLGVGGNILSSQSGSGTSGMNSIYAAILKLQSQAVLCDIYTGRRVYKNMLLRTISLENDFKRDNALYLNITCRQVILVNTSVVTISPQQGSASPPSTPASGNSSLPSLPSLPSAGSLLPSSASLLPGLSAVASVATSGLKSLIPSPSSFSLPSLPSLPKIPGILS